MDVKSKYKFLRKALVYNGLFMTHTDKPHFLDPIRFVEVLFTELLKSNNDLINLDKILSYIINDRITKLIVKYKY